MITCVLVLALVVGGLGAALHLLVSSTRQKEIDAILREIKQHRECVLITGGSAGLGLEFAKHWVADGYQVVLVARNVKRLEEARELLGSSVLIFSCDLSVPGAVEEQLIPFLDRSSLRVGVLVNNAGIGYAGRLHLQKRDPLLALLHINCTAPLALTHAVLPGMVERRRGVVVMVSSVSAYQPLPTHAAYSASKAFLSTLAFSLWEELRPHRVHVLAVEPGTIETGFASAAGQAPHHGARACDVVDEAMRALRRGDACSVFGWYVWARAVAASLLPRCLVAPLARRKMEPLDCNTAN